MILAWVWLAGCADPAAPDIAAFEELHAAIYEVWAAGDDRDAVHATLARSFTGEALTQAYLAHWSALTAQRRDGSEVRVTGVDYGVVEPLPPEDDGRPRLDAEWWVRGIVRHQTHAHPRINRYRAVYTLDGDGRIAGVALRDATRVRAAVDADVLFDDAASPSARGFMDPLELLQGLDGP